MSECRVVIFCAVTSAWRPFVSAGSCNDEVDPASWMAVNNCLWQYCRYYRCIHNRRRD